MYRYFWEILIAIFNEYVIINLLNIEPWLLLMALFCYHQGVLSAVSIKIQLIFLLIIDWNKPVCRTLNRSQPGGYIKTAKLGNFPGKRVKLCFFGQFL